MSWRVVHVITKLELGGAQLATLYEVAHGDFARGRRDLVYGTGGMLDPEIERLARDGVGAHPVPSLGRELTPVRDLRALWELWRCLRELRSREPRTRLLVHTHSSKAGIVGRWAAFFAGADLIVHSAHGFGHSHHGSAWQRRAFRVAERLSGRITDGFTGDSAANLHQGRAEGLFGRAPVRVVRCGIDVGAFAERRPGTAAAVRAALAIPGDHDVVLNLSCLKPQKDPLTYARVAARVLAHRPCTTFLLAGGGELYDALLAEVRRLGLDQRFIALGWRRDVEDLLAAADLMVLTSRWEGLPQVFAQAMAAGVPIVATRVDGAPEAVDHGDNGLLCEPGDEIGLAAAVTELLGDPERRRAMGERGRRRAGEFSRERMLETLEAFYEHLAGG